jgi:hypothetical protein
MNGVSFVLIVEKAIQNIPVLLYKKLFSIVKEGKKVLVKRSLRGTVLMRSVFSSRKNDVHPGQEITLLTVFAP